MSKMFYSCLKEGRAPQLSEPTLAAHERLRLISGVVVATMVIVQLHVHCWRQTARECQQGCPVWPTLYKGHIHLLALKVVVTRHLPLTAQSLTSCVSVAVAKSMDVWMFNPLSPIVDEVCFPGTFWLADWAGLAWLWACTAEQGREELSIEIASFDLILQPISKCCWQSLELHNKG